MTDSPVNQKDTPVLRAEDVSRLYRSGDGVIGVDITLRRGDFYGLLGPNGAGKSTTMYLLLGLIRKDAGTVDMNGHDVYRAPRKSKRGLGTLLEKPVFYPSLTAEENILVLKNHVEGVDRKEADRMLGEVGLGSVSDKNVRSFSSGMKQRLGIACALAGNPSIVFLDEPTSNLDPDGCDQMMELFKKLNKSHQVTFLYSTHRIEEAEDLCNRVGILKKGEIKREINWQQEKQIGTDRIQIQVDSVEKAKNVFRDRSESVRVQDQEQGMLEVSDLESDPGEINKSLVRSGIRVNMIKTSPKRLLDIYREV